MPIFEYSCANCETVEDRVVSSTTEHLQTCKICEEKLCKVETITPLNFQLKGVWFKTNGSY